MRNLFSKSIFNICFLFLFFTPNLFASGKGIIVAVCDRYAQTVVPSLILLRENYHCKLPIEVWHSGDELSSELKVCLSELEGITFRDISMILDGPPEEYRGFQIKAYMLKATDFDEVVLMDADVFFFEDPSIMFQHQAYIDTGAYLFRDQEWFCFGLDWKSHYPGDGLSTYSKRKEYISSHIGSPSNYVPPEWQHYWDPKYFPSKEKLVPTEHLESGCVVIDRRRHQKAIQYIVEFNDDRDYFYQLFLGDKESFWLGLEKAKDPYTINPEASCSYIADQSDESWRKNAKGAIDLVHLVDGELFFLQKTPMFPPVAPILVDNRCPEIPRYLSLTDEKWSPYIKQLTEKQKNQFQELCFWYHVYIKNYN